MTCIFEDEGFNECTGKKTKTKNNHKPLGIILVVGRGEWRDCGGGSGKESGARVLSVLTVVIVLVMEIGGGGGEGERFRRKGTTQQWNCSD
jgi:hypothetical protein